MNIRDTILGCDDKPTRAIEVPEWGVTVHVPTYSLAEISAAGQMKLTDMALLSASDAEGKPVFQAEDLDALKRKSYRACERIIDAFIELNGFGKKAVEKAAGN